MFSFSFVESRVHGEPALKTTRCVVEFYRVRLKNRRNTTMINTRCLPLKRTDGLKKYFDKNNVRFANRALRFELKKKNPNQRVIQD